MEEDKELYMRKNDFSKRKKQPIPEDRFEDDDDEEEQDENNKENKNTRGNENKCNNVKAALRSNKHP